MVIPLVVTLGLSAPLIGRLLDKYGTKIIMFAGTSILVLGLFMLSTFASSFYLFIVSGAVIGVGLSSVLGSPLRYIMLSESPASKRAAGQALININSSVGQLGWRCTDWCCNSFTGRQCPWLSISIPIYRMCSY